MLSRKLWVAWLVLLLALFVAGGVSAASSGQSLLVSTLAGTRGVPGAADGAGSAASFAGPGGLACDAAGNVFVADTDNSIIRKITPAGIVSTVVGAEAGLDSPAGVACDKDGNLYVADTYNHVIRKVDPAGVVSILAGAVGEMDLVDGPGAAARFCYPGGVACDAAGNVYVADTENQAIRKITPSGTVSTLVGLEAGLNSPAGVACDAAGTVYVADTLNSVILKVTPTGDISTLVGASAGLSYPAGVAVGAGGAVYITDTDAHAICLVSPSGDVSTVAGSVGEPGSADGYGSAARFDGPRGIARDAAGTIYVADTANDTVRRGTLDTSAPVTTASPPLASTPTEGWRNTPQTVTLVATDEGSGVAGTSYSIDDGPVLPYGGPFTVSALGSHVVSYFSTDNAGNVEAQQTGYVNIDSAPVTTASPALASTASSGWRAGPLTVTLTATDAGSGIASTSCSIDGGPTVTYTGPFEVSGSGSHTVTYFSTDNAGNTEQPQTGYVNIDAAPPITAAAPTLASSATSGWRNSPQTVTLTATDTASGVAGTSYSIDGGLTLTYGAPLAVSAPGSHAVTFFSTDNVGNAEQPQTGYVNIDTTVPKTKAQAAAVRAGRTVTLRFRVADAAVSCGKAVVRIRIERRGKIVEDSHCGLEGDKRGARLEVQGHAQEGDLHVARLGDGHRRQRGARQARRQADRQIAARMEVPVAILTLVREDLVADQFAHPQHVEDALHGRREVARRQGRALALHVEAEAHEDAGPRGIDELHVREIEDDGLSTAGSLCHRLAQSVGAIEIHLAGEEHGGRRARGDRCPQHALLPQSVLRSSISVVPVSPVRSPTASR